MGAKEVRRAGILDRVKSGQLGLRAAAELMGVGHRQAKRLWSRFRKSGDKGLVHGHAGRPSNRRKPRRFRAKVLKLVRTRYGGEEGKRFGPTLAAEHLAEDEGLAVDAETLRRWMLAEGLWSRERKRKPHRQRRERRKHFGELVQLDGSFHHWLEERGPRLCAMNMVDDATSTVLLAFHEQETIWAAADVYRRWVEEYGVPLALYTDWKNVYVREPTEAELLAGDVVLTQFGRMCAKLGTRIIAANSPQAKGRVERNHGTHQDRLIKKLRLGKIATVEAANQFLQQRYLPDHNRRFRREPAQPDDYHHKAPGKRELDAIFRLEEQRTISNDWVVRYQGRFLQVQRESRHAPAGGKVTVSEGRDGSLQILYRARTVAWNEIGSPVPRPPAPLRMPKSPVQIRVRSRRPGADHPWRQPLLSNRRGEVTA